MMDHIHIINIIHITKGMYIIISYMIKLVSRLLRVLNYSLVFHILYHRKALTPLGDFCVFAFLKASGRFSID